MWLVVEHDIIEELCKSLLQRYQGRLEEKMKGSDLVHNNVDLFLLSSS